MKDDNPYSRLMALQRMGIVDNYEEIRSKTVAIVVRAPPYTLLVSSSFGTASSHPMPSLHSLRCFFQRASGEQADAASPSAAASYTITLPKTQLEAASRVWVAPPPVRRRLRGCV